MRRLFIATLLVVLAPSAFAEHGGRFAPYWGARDVVIQARRLDAAAGEIHRRLHARTGRSPLAHHAHELAESTRQLRHQAERGAPPARLERTYGRIGKRYQRLERALFEAHRRHGDHGYGHRSGPRHLFGAVRDFERAYHATGSSLWRYAGRQRDRRDRYVRDDRYRRDHDDRRRYGPARHLN